MSTERPMTEKSNKSKRLKSSRPKPLSMFVIENAKFKHSVISKKHVIFCNSVVLASFDHLNLANSLRSSSLEYFVTIKEQVYPEFIKVFYSNLEFWYPYIQSRVKDVNINLSIENFTHIFGLSCEGVDIFNLDLHDFEYLDSETALTASRLLHYNDNSALVRNEEVKYYILLAQILAKIVFNNFLPIS